jgi:hypothetical protein
MLVLGQAPRGILGSANELIKMRIRVISPPDAVFEIQRLIQERDRKAREDHEIFGTKLPSWVGRA